MANLPGTSANNTIAGTNQADSIVGFQGNDSITAANGNDAVWGGDGNDSLFGGGGNDTLYGDQDRVATWGYRVYDRNFTSDNNQAFTIESGTLRGSGLATALDPTSHVLSARGTSGDPNDFGIIYTSTFTATTAGTYTFRLTSDDGSTMRLLDASGTPLVWSAQSTGQTGLTYLNNDFHQPATTRQASVTLAAGQTYTIEIRIWENEGAQVLSADVQPPGSSAWQSLSDNTTYIGTGVHAGNDSLDGGAGDDLIYGDGGNDSIWGGAGADIIYGGAGNDTIQLGADGNADLAYGGDGNDSILTEHTSTTVADTVYGDGGDDHITGGSGIELIFGGAGNDTLIGGAGNDTLHGDDDADRLEGGDGNDQLFGGSGNDTLIGGNGNDVMQGGIGSDRFILLANHGTDTITGGEDVGDVDVVDATALTASLTVSVTGFESGTLTGGGLNTTFSQIERLELGSGNDTVTVANGSQPIFVDGNGGIDRLTVNGGPVGRNLFVLNDNAAGTFTPGNGAPPINFGPSLPMKLSNILAAYKTGTFVINGTTPLSGQIGQVVFEDFEILNLQMICFVRGARIRTPGGWRAIEDLRAGDLVETLDRGAQPIRWIGSSRRVARGDMAPVLIRAGALGNVRDLRVSPQHRMLVEGWQANLLFGEDAVLVPAKALVNGREVIRDEGGVVEYFHMLFDRHEIVWAEGCASESFHPGEQGWNALDAATRAEVLALFPVLAGGDFAAWGPAARPSVRAFEGRALARMLWPADQRKAGRKPAAAASAAVQNQRSPLAAEMRVAV